MPTVSITLRDFLISTIDIPFIRPFLYRNISDVLMIINIIVSTTVLYSINKYNLRALSMFEKKTDHIDTYPTEPL